MKRWLIILIAAAAIISGGWIFRRAVTVPQDALYSSSRNDGDFSVRHDPRPAFDAAAHEASKLVDAGWVETPVSTKTFRLLTRDGDVTAIVAEDLSSGGSRITVLHRRHALW